MRESDAKSATSSPRPWDARVARWMIRPLVHTWVTPNQLTTVRLLVGIASMWAFSRGGYAMGCIGGLLFALSNFLDHADGELARLSGKTSRLGHLYDLGSDALIHVLIFGAIGMGLRDNPRVSWDDDFVRWAMPLGAVAGAAISLMFYLRMRIEERLGKTATTQPSIGGFEVEDVLYLLPLVAFADGLKPFLMAAAVGAPLYAVWVSAEYLRLLSAPARSAAQAAVQPPRP